MEIAIIGAQNIQGDEKDNFDKKISEPFLALCKDISIRLVRRNDFTINRYE